MSAIIDRIIDRAIALSPLAVLVYALRRHEAQQVKLLELLDRDRAAFRDERRELINRITAPHLIPQGTRPIAASTRDTSPMTAAQQARAAFAQVGHAAAPFPPEALPTDDDDVQSV